jgi:hypothetical protein
MDIDYFLCRLGRGKILNFKHQKEDFLFTRENKEKIILISHRFTLLNPPKEDR